MANYSGDAVETCDAVTGTKKPQKGTRWAVATVDKCYAFLPIEHSLQLQQCVSNAIHLYSTRGEEGTVFNRIQSENTCLLQPYVNRRLRATCMFLVFDGILTIGYIKKIN